MSVQGMLFPNKAKKYWASLPVNSAEDGYAKNLYSHTNQYLYNHFFEGFDSVLEIGSNCGNRLIQAAEIFPDKTFVGLDINAEAVKLGCKIIKEHKLNNIKLLNVDLSSIPDLDLERFGKYDIVFSWASLIYIHPLHIKKLLKKIINLTNKQILILERNNLSKSIVKTFADYFWNSPNWAHNYSQLILKIEKNAKIKTHEIPKVIWHPGGGKGTIVNVELKNT